MKKILVTLLFASPLFALAQNFDRDLYYGIQSDPAVTQLQEFLTDQSVYSGPISGNFFSLTLQGVKAFQTKQGITPISGYFGPISRGKANQILTAEGISSTGVTNESGNTTPITTTPPKTTSDVVTALMAQIQLLQQQLNALQAQQQTLQTIQQQQVTQTQTLNQIQTNTTPTPTPTPIPTPTITPTVKFNYESQNVSLATQGFKVSWTSVYVESCSASGAWSGSKPKNGEEILSFNQTGSFTYTLTCVGNNGESVSANVVIKVIDTKPKITFYFNDVLFSNTFSGKVGETVKLGWESSNTYGGNSCTASNSWSGSKYINGSQNILLETAGEFPYALTCINGGSGESGTNTATITVAP